MSVGATGLLLCAWFVVQPLPCAPGLDPLKPDAGPPRLPDLGAALGLPDWP